MKNLNIFKVFFIFFISLGVVSCGSDDDSKGGNLNVRFKLVYGDLPLEMFKQYEYPNTNDKFFMTRLSFFISDMKLKSTTNEASIKDIDYINLTNAYTGGVPANGYEYLISDIKAGEYTSLNFGIGVPKESNGKEPKDFPANSLLSSSAEYWSSWKSYIFFRPEGKIGLNGSTNIDTDFALHLGADEAYRNIKLDKTISIQGGVTTNVDVTIDMYNFFDGKTRYDINDTQQIHSLFQMPLILELANNLEVAIK
jgi:hypothetical protein